MLEEAWSVKSLSSPEALLSGGGLPLSVSSEGVANVERTWDLKHRLCSRGFFWTVCFASCLLRELGDWNIQVCVRSFVERVSPFLEAGGRPLGTMVSSQSLAWQDVVRARVCYPHPC